MELWKERCVFMKRRVCFGESSASCWKFFLQWKYWKWPRMDCANGNSCYRIVVLITADSYSVVYVYFEQRFYWITLKTMIRSMDRCLYQWWINGLTIDFVYWLDMPTPEIETQYMRNIVNSSMDKHYNQLKTLQSTQFE